MNGGKISVIHGQSKMQPWVGRWNRGWICISDTPTHQHDDAVRVRAQVVLRPVVRHVEVVGLRRELGRQRVDLLDAGPHAQLQAAAPDDDL